MRSMKRQIVIKENAINVPEEVCLNCGMLQSEWKGNQGQGYYGDCCQGCAEGTGCTCGDENE